MGRMKKIDSRNIECRLKSVQGHLCGIERMLFRCQDMEDVLHQIAAVRAAIDRLTSKVAFYCVLDSLQSALREGETPEDACCRAIRLIASNNL